MVSRVVFWTGFGVLTRIWQLGLQQTSPFSHRGLGWLAYPVFGGVGASFGYWLEDVDKSQTALLQERKDAILAKRARRAAREAEAAAREAEAAA